MFALSNLLGALASVVDIVLSIFYWLILIRALISWVNPDPHNPVSGLLRNLTSPVLRPIGKILPTMGGMDLSPIIALIGLMFIKRLILYIFQLL